jgi:hypothetical protein
MLNSTQPFIKIAQYLSVFFDFDNCCLRLLFSAVCGCPEDQTMEIVIDGYNLIGSDAGLTGNLQHKRNWLVQKLASYQRAKGA